MFLDARTLEAGRRLECDLCIVGGGAAGIAIARQLAGGVRDVIVVESGGFEADAESQSLYAGETAGLPYFALDDTRCRRFGGSTWRWGARGAPMNEIDFARRDWVPHSGWPWPGDELAPYYRRCEQLIGMNSPFDYDERVWRRLGIPGPALDPAHLRIQAFQFGRRVLFARHYRAELERAPNIRVLLHANALRLDPSPRGDHVEGVRLATLADTELSVVARRFVLACGGIENPRLLLLSGGADGRGLANGSGLVGRGFLEHPTLSVGTVETEDPHRLLDLFAPGRLAGRRIEVGFALSEPAQREARSLNAVAAVRPTLAPDATQAARELAWDLMHRRLRPGLGGRLARVASDPLGLAANLLRSLRGRPLRLRVDSLAVEARIEQAPSFDNRVELAESRDRFGLRRARLVWGLGALDEHTVRTLAARFGRETERLGFGRFRPAEWLADGDFVAPADLVGGHHHMGTTRLSALATEGVVDADCRAHDVDNLYLAGSSLFPTAGFVNPTPTLLALALRLADRLRASGPD